jgi:CheY-like chemotaxis protein
MSEPLSILLAEDDENDVLLLRRAFKEADVQNPLHVAGDGQEAIEFLARLRTPPQDHMPALVILDLKMPRRDGLEVLEWIKGQPVMKGLPVILFSSSANRGDIEQAYALGANGFVVKPPSLSERADFARFIKQWLRFNQPPLACTEGICAAQAAYARRGFGPRPSA